jgi:hypothetical protein
VVKVEFVRTSSFFLSHVLQLPANIVIILISFPISSPVDSPHRLRSKNSTIYISFIKSKFDPRYICFQWLFCGRHRPAYKPEQDGDLSIRCEHIELDSLAVFFLGLQLHLQSLMKSTSSPLLTKHLNGYMDAKERMARVLGEFSEPPSQIIRFARIFRLLI